MYVGSESTSLYLCSFNEAQGDVKLISTITAQYPSCIFTYHPLFPSLYLASYLSSHFFDVNVSLGSPPIQGVPVHH